MRRPLLSLLAVAGLVAGCAGESPEVPVGPDGVADPVLVEGREIFSGRCANCHGASGGGGQGSKLSDGAVVASFPDPADQAEVVRNGRNAMPSFGDALDDDQIDAVVRYTREVL